MSENTKKAEFILKPFWQNNSKTIYITALLYADQLGGKNLSLYDVCSIIRTLINFGEVIKLVLRFIGSDFRSLQSANLSH